MLALLILLVAVGFTSDQWFPWLFENLSDQKKSSFLSALQALIGIATTVVAGIAAMVGWRAKSTATAPVLQPSKDSDAAYVQDRAYEPTPLPTTAAELEQNRSPYLGLSAFQQKDAHLFFGRHLETREALAWLGAPIRGESAPGGGNYRWLQIEGNSGAGKSSLVNAGMLPLVEQGALHRQTGFRRWIVIGPMMPGEQPLRRLAEVLEQSLVNDPDKRDTLARQQRLESDERALAYLINDHKTQDTAYLLVIDQFEELFTFSRREEKHHFDRQLAHALQDRDCPLYLINTVRIDYLEGFEQLPELSELYMQALPAQDHLPGGPARGDRAAGAVGSARRERGYRGDPARCQR